jgi:hypothetical protein
MEQYTLVRDCTKDMQMIVFITKGDFIHCLNWIHKNTSFSMYWAEEYEGYKLLKTK